MSSVEVVGIGITFNLIALLGLEQVPDKTHRYMLPVLEKGIEYKYKLVVVCEIILDQEFIDVLSCH